MRDHYLALSFSFFLEYVCPGESPLAIYNWHASGIKASCSLAKGNDVSAVEMKQTDVHAIKISHVLQGKLGAPVSVAGNQLLGCLSSLENPAEDSASGAASQKPESPPGELGKEFRGSKT